MPRTPIYTLLARASVETATSHYVTHCCETYMTCEKIVAILSYNFTYLLICETEISEYYLPLLEYKVHTCLCWIRLWGLYVGLYTYIAD